MLLLQWLVSGVVTALCMGKTGVLPGSDTCQDISMDYIDYDPVSPMVLCCLV